MAASRYSIRLTELEAGAHVPLHDQKEVEPIREPPDGLSPADLDRRRLLNDPAGAGRLRPGS
jgi:hypothetical protein